MVLGKYGFALPQLALGSAAPGPAATATAVFQSEIAVNE